MSELTNEVGGCGRIQEGARPAAAGIAQSSVLDQPGRHAGVSSQPVSEVREVVVVEGTLPASAVDHDGDRKGSGAGGNAQAAELLRGRSIRDDDTRPRRGEAGDI